MPTWLYILLGILLFFAFLLFLPVFCRITYREELKVCLEILFLRFPLYPKKEKRLKAAHKKKKGKQKKKPKEKKKTDKSASPLGQIRMLLSIIKEHYPRLLTVLTMRLKRLRVTVAAEDAAKAAILYGEASLALSAFLELLEGFCDFKQDKGAVSLTPDFLGEDSSFDAVLLLHTTLWRVLGLGLRLSFSFLKHRQRAALSQAESKEADSKAAIQSPQDTNTSNP